MSFPKCRVGTKTDHPCRNEASVDPFGTGEYFICEQHYRLQELSNEETDWSIARDYGVATAAFGANGGNFILGKTNVATLLTKLWGQQGVNGAMFEVQNNNSGTDDTALSLKVQSGESPMKVDSPTKVTNLNADRVDGQDVTQIGVNGLQRVEAESAENSVSSKQATAVCPSGKVLVGTGFDIFGGKSGTSPNQETNVMMDFVIPGSTFVTVAAYEDEATSANWHVRAIAICATAGTL